MATKTISILDDVYHKLLKLKREDESFSEELDRLLEARGNISDCAGLWNWMKENEAIDIEENIRKRRELSKNIKKEKVVL